MDCGGNEKDSLNYYAVDGSSYERNIMAGSLGTVATSTYTGSTASLIYHHKDHLGGTHVESDSSGTSVEYIIYTPFGGTLVDVKAGSYENDHKYTDKEKDEDTGLYYYGARYYNSTIGMFTAQDPVYLGLGTGKLSILNDPQMLNSYSYSRNNPINNIDPTGEMSIQALLQTPLSTAAQFIFWNAGAAGLNDLSRFFGGGGYGVSKSFIQRSLTINPGTLNINESNQKNYGNVISQIRNSGEYQSKLNEFIGLANTGGYSNINSYDLESFSSAITFTENSDLYASIHSASIYFEGTKSEDGTWNINTNIYDRFNFEAKSFDSFNQLNQAGVISQGTGIFSEYDINIDFSEEKK